MNDGEKQCSLTRAALSTCGRAKNQIPAISLCVLIAACQIGVAATLVFQDGQDGYFGTRDIEIVTSHPDTPWQYDDVYLDYPDATGWGSEGLLKFTSLFGTGASQIPAGASITSATLTLCTPSSDTAAAGNGGTFHRMLVAWDETSTWNSLGNGIQADGTDAASATSFAVGSSNTVAGFGYYSFDVTSDVRLWSTGATNQGWGGLPWTGGTDGWAFASRRAAVTNQRPRLSVTFTPRPQISIRLSQVELCWDTTTNTWYQLQYRSSLTGQTWAPLTTWMAGDARRFCTNDAVLIGQPQRFYQVAVTNAAPQP